MIMNTHPEIVSIGEFSQITDEWANPKTAVMRVGCEECYKKGIRCPILPTDEFPFPLREGHRKASQRAGKPWVCDTSKDARAFEKYEQTGVADEYRYVVLIKKPDAAAASYVKHYTPANPKWNPDAPASPSGDGISSAWCKQYEHVLKFAQHRRDHLRVFKYEELSNTPEVVLEQVADLLGLENQFDFKHYQEHELHQIAGNWSAKTEKRPISYERPKHLAEMSIPAWHRMHEVYHEVLGLRKEV